MQIVWWMLILAPCIRPALNSKSWWMGPALEAEWRRLYPIAWADFQRFLKGWCPQHTKLNAYSEQMTQIAIQSLRHS
jgi:hypothetical protein